MKKEDPLKELQQSEEWRKGYKAGYRAGEDSMMNDMAYDFELGEKQGFEEASKAFNHVLKIVNSWNVKEIPAVDALSKILKYLKNKTKFYKK